MNEKRRVLKINGKLEKVKLVEKVEIAMGKENPDTGYWIEKKKGYVIAGMWGVCEMIKVIKWSDIVDVRLLEENEKWRIFYTCKIRRCSYQTCSLAHTFFLFSILSLAKSLR